MIKIKFTIIMPCYNSETYVKEAIDSLINQEYQNWNLIAVNDGSTDDTLKILSEYALKDKRIQVVTKKNGGYSTAINCGLEKVTGDYFLMMGSDDKLSSDLLHKIVETINNDELPDVIAFRAMKYLDGVPYEIDEVSNFENVAFMKSITIDEFERLYPKHSKILFIRDTAKCFKSDLLGSLRYFGTCGYDADGVFSSLFMHKCHSFLCLPIFGYLWTKRDNSVSASTNKHKNLDRIKVWSKYISTLKVLKCKNITNQEKKYIFYPIKVSVELLSDRTDLSLRELLIMCKAMKKAFSFASKNEIDLGEYKLPKNIIKKAIYYNLPILWLKRHGFVNKKMV